jgi:hypothetical protein
MKTGLAWAGGTLAVLVVLVGVPLGGWQAGWWFKAQNTTRQNELIQNGYSNQLTLRQQVAEKFSEVENIGVQLAKAGNDTSLTPSLLAQRASIAGIVCQDAAEITGTPLPADQAAWVGANCANGTLSPNSSLYQAG